MLAAFWSGLGGEFAKQWAARIFTPAFAFWLGGLALVWWHRHAAGVRRHGWHAELAATATSLTGLSVFAQGLLLVGALLLVALSALAADRLTLPLLRTLEGYWTRPRWLRSRAVAHRRSRYQHWRARVDQLNLKQRMGALDTAEFVELVALENAPANDPSRLLALRQRRAQGLDGQAAAELGRGRRFLRHTPTADALGMPTRLGDILRAAETRPADKYGLDTVVCWYALWLLLSAETKTELVQARTALDKAAGTWLWGALFLVWTPWSWWAVPIALLVPALSYNLGILGAARLFGELTVSTYDLYRFRLYENLHLPTPTSPQQERRETGPQVTNQLWGGLDGPGVRYVDPPAGKDASG